MEQGKGCLNMIPNTEINVDLIRFKKFKLTNAHNQ